MAQVSAPPQYFLVLVCVCVAKLSGLARRSCRVGGHAVLRPFWDKALGAPYGLASPDLRGGLEEGAKHTALTEVSLPRATLPAQ